MPQTLCQRYKQQLSKLTDLYTQLGEALAHFNTYGKTKNPHIITELIELKEQLETKTQLFEEEFKEYLIRTVYERFSGELHTENQSFSFEAGGGVLITAFSPDGSAIAVGSGDKMLRIFGGDDA